LCGDPCGVLVTHEIVKNHSTGLSDRLRERKRVEIDLAFVASSTGSKLFGIEPRETNRRVHLY
jgi:hypothetical protein